MRRKRLRIISLFLAMMLLLSTAIPIGSVFAADYDVKYHPNDWFGYHHSKAEINGWISEAIKKPVISDGALEMLTGEIRPGDIISFQVEVEMPSGHEEILPFFYDFSFNMAFPYGATAMIEVYASDAPLMTDEEYEKKLDEFNSAMDCLEATITSEEFLRAIESGEVSKLDYTYFSDMINNRDRYYEIYLNQLKFARTKYGVVSDNSSYGNIKKFMGAFEEQPDIDSGEIQDFESFRDAVREESYIEPKFSDEEYERLIHEFNETYPQYIALLEEQFAEIEEQYRNGEIGKDEWVETEKFIENARESFADGTFYNTILEYLNRHHEGWYIKDYESFFRFIVLALSGQDKMNAYLGSYTYEFSDSKVQSNKPCTYIFDINIIATKALSVGSYVSVPALHWFYDEHCPTEYITSLYPLKEEKYYPCNSHTGSDSFINIDFGNTSYPDGFDMLSTDDNFDEELLNDKRLTAFMFIDEQYGDSEYHNVVSYEYLSKWFDENTLKAIRPFVIQYVDENGNIIKTETEETSDAYFNILPKDIYDFQLVGPENIKGVIENEDTTVTFYYEHKDTDISVSFVDTVGNQLAPTEVVSGKTLDEYTTTPAAVYGYEPVAIPDNAVGVLHEDSADIQYVYDLKDTAVSVNHLDTKGNKISDSEIIRGKVFDNYHTAPKNIYGYELVETPNNNSGKMSEDIINVNYVYQLKDSAVTVNYLDDNGNALDESEIINGKVFDSYITAAKDIYGYRLTSMPINNVGKITEESITVNYIYTTKPASVTVNYIDESGSVLSGSEVITGNVFDTYTSEVKDIYGYILINHPESASGIMAEEVISVDYVYRKIFDKLPDEPYKAVYGNKLSDIELPFGWIFEDTQTNPDATVGDAGSNTFTVIVPADEFHSEIRETVTIVVSKADWIEGVDYDILPTEPYEAEFGDLLSSIKLPKGWIFVDSDGDTTVGEAGINVFDVIVLANKNHPEIKGTITVKVTADIDEPIVPEEPDDNNSDEEKPSEPIVDKPSEELPNEPIDNPIINKIPSNDEKGSAISHAEITIDDTDTKTEKQSEKVIINPDTGSNELLIPVVLTTVGSAAAFLIICKKRTSAVQ